MSRRYIVINLNRDGSLPSNINRRSVRKCGHLHKSYETATACFDRLVPEWSKTSNRQVCVVSVSVSEVRWPIIPDEDEYYATCPGCGRLVLRQPNGWLCDINEHEDANRPGAVCGTRYLSEESREARLSNFMAANKEVQPGAGERPTHNGFVSLTL